MTAQTGLNQLKQKGEFISRTCLCVWWGPGWPSALGSILLVVKGIEVFEQQWDEKKSPLLETRRWRR